MKPSLPAPRTPLQSLRRARSLPGLSLRNSSFDRLLNTRSSSPGSRLAYGGALTGGGGTCRRLDHASGIALNALPVWLEAEGARRSAANIGSMTAAPPPRRRKARSARPRRAAARVGPPPPTARPSGARATTRVGRPVVAQRDHELVGPEKPIVRIWSVDVRSDTGVELGHGPSDRTAQRPLPVWPAIAGRNLDRQHGEPPLRLGR